LSLCIFATMEETGSIPYELYEPVIGLEIHAQLNTLSKAYSSDSASYGGAPNTHVSPISLGHPGTLPRPNKAVVEAAIKLGLACGCDITEYNRYARKNYFYADLPKGYQITQDKTPICTGGAVTVDLEDGEQRTIGLTRIHMEEDSGKSIHDLDPFHSLIDLNRAGVPLLEIVSEPDIRSAEEAGAYVAEIRKLVRYLEICDGNMEEGSLRCDANISVRKKGTEKFGTKVEVKNMNSMRNVQRAINYEIKRQIEALESGEALYQETRNFDAVQGTTSVMRSKEDAHDYRYFPEPDIHPLVVRQPQIDAVQKSLPPLPAALLAKYVNELGLPEYDARIITESKPFALYFERVLESTTHAKSASNWMMGPVKMALNERGIGIEELELAPSRLAQLIELVESGAVSFSAASQTLLPLLLNEDTDPKLLAERENLIQERDDSALEQWIDAALSAYPEKVVEYQNGKKGLIGLFMGEVMKASKGKADPKKTNQLLQAKLKS
jgi:aspartyl-tRNA(Asn)/glutamyl-tRNA(Gln) amidotransferase subunit B